MSVGKLKEAYDAADDAQITSVERIKRILNFKTVLEKYLAPAFDEFHYELLRRRKTRLLYQTTRSEFDKRPNAEIFLLGKLKSETDEEMQADILQILGHLRSPQANGIAKQFLLHENKNHREVALFVLGWIGAKETIPLLQEHMLNEDDPHLRITAASAHRQLVFRHPELKCDVLQSLKTGFEKETNGDALSWIIVMIGTIAVKNLGLREDKEEPDVLHGDLERAKEKTAAFLKTLTFDDQGG